MLYAYCPGCQPEGIEHREGAPAPSLAWCRDHLPGPSEEEREARRYMTGAEASALARRRRIARLTGEDA